MPETKTMVVWCLPCRGHKTIENPHPKYVDGARGRRLQYTGKCPDCGNIVNRFIRPDSLGDGEEVQEDVGSDTEDQIEQTAETDKDTTPQRVWLGTCQRCREDSEFTGRYVGRRWDGKNVVDGVCVLCEAPQIVIGAEERVTEDG